MVKIRRKSDGLFYAGASWRARENSPTEDGFTTEGKTWSTIGRARGAIAYRRNDTPFGSRLPTDPDPFIGCEFVTYVPAVDSTQDVEPPDQTPSEIRRREREAREQSESHRREQLKQAALAKLTPAEREALEW